jgi:hypothetical protein
MSRICQGCGGVLGRDCWNEADCVQISNQQAHDLYINEFLQRDLADAEIRIKFLEQFILESGLEIPYPIIEPISAYEDWLPF